MHIKPTLTRRQALAGAALLPAAAAVAPAASFAAAEMKGASTLQTSRFTMGGFEVTTLNVGARPVESPQGIFGMNVSPETFATVSEENFLPTDKLIIQFNPTVVNTGSELILFDTGLNPGVITGALANAGYTPDQIDTVVITHMHGDHIGGLMGEDGATFKNARYLSGAAEHNHWSQSDNENYASNVEPLAEQFTFLDNGGSVASGITAMEAFGHTPGHMAYMIESDGKQLVLFADLANHYVWSLAYPDWEVRFDMDKGAAAATRRRILDMLAADKIPFIGYHMPFPAVGYASKRDDGFHYTPASYQMAL